MNKIFKDISFWMLLTSNVIAIFLAAGENWNIFSIMLVYWFQSSVIGLFNFVRILKLEDFSTAGFKANRGVSFLSKDLQKVFYSLFFLFHYGVFHLTYLFFIFPPFLLQTALGIITLQQVGFVILGCLMFFGNHLYSSIYNAPKEPPKQNLAALMFYPYLRIIPMQLTVLLMFYLKEAVILFLVLKTIADLLMHVVEHTYLRRGISPQQAVSLQT